MKTLQMLVFVLPVSVCSCMTDVSIMSPVFLYMFLLWPEISTVRGGMGVKHSRNHIEAIYSQWHS